MKEKNKKYWMKVFFLTLYVMPAMFLMSKVETTFISSAIFGIVTIIVFMIIDKIIDDKYNI